MPNQQATCRQLAESPDSTLIDAYVNDGSAAAFEVLVRRHYNGVHKRLLSLTQNKADADDLAQKLWLRVLENLPSYTDKQKFPNFLNTIATNLMRDEWRKKSNQQSSLDEVLDKNPRDSAGNLIMLSDEDIESKLHSRSEINYLVRELIPKLPLKLRAVFLLRHESEYWDQKQPFQWQHLAELNGLTAQSTSQRFNHTRDQLLAGDAPTVEDENLLIFILWTQSQRFNKAEKQTESYLAQLLGIPVNTFKTRYRSALSELESGLQRWRSQTVN